MAVENEGKTSSNSTANILENSSSTLIPLSSLSHNNEPTVTITATSSAANITKLLSNSSITQQQNYQPSNGNISENSNIGNCSSSSLANTISVNNNGLVIGGSSGISASSKSETSSNASVNGSIKKLSSSNNTLINSSREDIQSIGGTSSVNSNNNNSKGGKDLHSHFYNGLPSSASARRSEMEIDGDGLGSLPQKWEKAYTENGELYFIDHNTGTSHWLDPRLSKFQKKSLEDCMDDELPYGWEKIDDPQYGTYFIDHVNRRTQYENPVLEAKRRVERKRSSNDDSAGNHDEPNINSNSHQRPINSLPYTFTRNPTEMRGERITTTLLKSSRGLGITIVGGDDNVEEFLQIKSIVPNGPAWLDEKLQTGDVLVYVNDTCVLGFTHHEMVNVFQSILPGETVTLEVCRGYPLPFDPNDPNTEVVTTIAVDGISADSEKSRILMDLNLDGNYNFLDLSDTAGAVGGQIPQTVQKNAIAKIQTGSESTENYVGGDGFMFKQPEILQIPITKGIMGFGFTIADSAHGQKVKKILDRNCCKNLQEGDILLEINLTNVKLMTHCEVVQVLKDCPKSKDTVVKVQRGHYFNSMNMPSRMLNGFNDFHKQRKTSQTKETVTSGMFRSKTPTADIYSTQPKEILPIRPKTPLVDTRRARVKTPSNELNEEVEAVTSGLLSEQILNSSHNSDGINKSMPLDSKSNNSLNEVDSINNDIPYLDPYPKLVTSLTERLAEASLLNENHNLYQHQMDVQQSLHHQSTRLIGESNATYDTNSINQEYNAYGAGPYSHPVGNSVTVNDPYSAPPPMPIMAPVPTYHQDTCYCYNCQDYNRYQMDYQNQTAMNYGQHSLPHNGRMQKRLNEYMIERRKAGFSPLENHHSVLSMQNHSQPQYGQKTHLWKYSLEGHNPQTLVQPILEDEFTLSEVTLDRQTLGFGFRIVGGTEEGSQVTVGHIVPGGSADGDPSVATGDEILSIDGVNVVSSSHHKVVQLMGEAALRGQVTMILRRRVINHHNIHPQQHQLDTLPFRGIHYPYDVIVSRNENEGFGFVIISSSNQFYGSTIGKLMPDSPADRCGELKVGDRIISVNRIDIAGMSHGEVVNLIKESGLHVRLTIGAPQDVSTVMPTNGSNISQAEQTPILTAAIKKQTEENAAAAIAASSSNGGYFDRTQLNLHPQL